MQNQRGHVSLENSRMQAIRDELKERIAHFASQIESCARKMLELRVDAEGTCTNGLMSLRLVCHSLVDAAGSALFRRLDGQNASNAQLELLAPQRSIAVIASHTGELVIRSTRACRPVNMTAR